MRELKPELYRRNMEFRTNKIIRLIRQLGQCSEQSVCQYDADQMEQIFLRFRPNWTQPDAGFILENAVL